MRQVLFHIPIVTEFTPDGIPVYGFGAMLFLVFVLCTWFLSRWARSIQLPSEKTQDMVIWLFITGIIGARITFMIQYKRPISEFIQIWQGGIVFYGSAIGGFIGYRLFYRKVLTRFGISTWQLADMVAPTLALGLIIGRIGCLLNGCCYGHIAAPGAYSVEFPLLSCPARDALVSVDGLQTTVGFSTQSSNRYDDSRTVVGVVEPNSPAALAGVQPGDRIIGINGQPNRAILEVMESSSAIELLRSSLNREKIPSRLIPGPEGSSTLICEFEEMTAFRKAQEMIKQVAGPLPVVLVTDSLAEMVRDWPRGNIGLQLAVDRAGKVVELPSFTPRSIPLYPTQIYESISMLILFLFLITLYPLRPHNGFVFVVLMLGYAIHRFINEQLRNDTDVVAFGLTLSQNISVLIFLSGLFLEWCLVTRTGQSMLTFLDRQEKKIYDTGASFLGRLLGTSSTPETKSQQ